MVWRGPENAPPLAIACSVLSDGEGEATESDYKEGDITLAQYRWLWADEKIDDFQKNAAASSRRSRSGSSQKKRRSISAQRGFRRPRRISARARKR